MIKRFFFGGTLVGTQTGEAALFILRAFFGLSLALAHGMGKVPPPQMLIDGVASMGFPMPVAAAWAAGLAEFVGGICIALGLFTRPAALFTGFTMFVAGFVVHGQDPFQKKELAFAYLCISLVFIAIGSGRTGLDRFFRGVTSTVKTAR